MSTRYVTLADGRKIGLGSYVNAWQRCRELAPETHIGRGISGRGETASEALYELRRGMHDRINRHIPGFGRGRKWESAWYWQARRLTDDVNTPRLIVREPAYRPVITEFRRRLAHRLYSDLD